jgi:hypothetical protein
VNIQSFVSEYCPHCGAEVEFRSGLFSRNTIGPEKEPCPHCNEDYVTGRKEWAHMSRAERRDYYRRTTLRCLAAFVFFIMGMMLVVFMATGAMFKPVGQKAMAVSLAVSITGGLVLAARVFQLSRRTIHASLEREPLE